MDGHGTRPPTSYSYDEFNDSEEENISSSPAKSPSLSPNMQAFDKIMCD